MSFVPESDGFPEPKPFADLARAFSGPESVQRATRVHIESIQRHGKAVPGNKRLRCSPEATCRIGDGQQRLRLLWQVGGGASVHIVPAGQLSLAASIATITSSDWAALDTADSDGTPVDPQQILQVVKAIDDAVYNANEEAGYDKAAKKRDRKERRRRWWRRHSDDVGLAVCIACIVVFLGGFFTVIFITTGNANSYTNDAVRSAQVYAPNDRPFQPTHSDQYDNQTVKGLDSESALLVPSSHPTAIDVLGDSCTNVARTIRAGDRFRVVYSGSGNATVTIDAQHDNITVCPVKGASISRDDQVIIQGVHGK